MIFITGDTHIPIDISKLNVKNFPQQQGLTKSDYIIICGDFGAIWDESNQDKYWLKWLESKPFTTLFVDGNHENFDLLYKYPEVIYNGGKAHKIRDSIYHLMRGQRFTLNNTTFFTMGGAESHDRPHIEGKSWWEMELPTPQEYDEALRTLDSINWEVDYIITHSAPDKIQDIVSNGAYIHNKLTNFLQNVYTDCKYRHWFFGHYHTDIELDGKHTAIYNKIIQLDT